MNQPAPPQQRQRSLVRSRRDRVIAGVCGGLADYFRIDPIIVRLIFVALLFGGGSGFLVYVILWIVMPEEGAVARPADERVKAFGREVKEGADRVAGEFRAAGRSSDRKTLFGFIIVIVGVVILLNQLFPHSWFRGDLAWAFIVIGFGAYLLLKR
ncbi:MAG: PspC domain-containing protein [Candidatus Kerfeldbacteria bacterium]|nr:PspC domain-containing protein [Candidatus Kerfeldbacteria bacterium]